MAKAGSPPVAYRWKPGQSGNPTGSSAQTLARRIREMTDNGQQLLDILAKICTGQIKARPHDQIEALKVLLERGWGKSPELVVNVNADAGQVDIAALASAHLERIARSLTPGPTSPLGQLGTERAQSETPPDAIDAEFQDKGPA